MTSMNRTYSRVRLSGMRGLKMRSARSAEVDESGCLREMTTSLESTSDIISDKGHQAEEKRDQEFPCCHPR